MTNTTNYDLILVEGNDKVNPLTQVNPNFEAIDEQMKKNEDAGVSTATELLTGSIHGLTRANADASMFRFTATSNYTAGDTFTVDGIQVTALTPTGEALGNGSYIIGSEVLCCLKGTLLTMFLSGGSVTVADNALKLGGEEPSYYGTAADVTQAQQTASAAGVLANAVQTQLVPIAEAIESLKNVTTVNVLDATKTVSGSVVCQHIDLEAGTYIINTNIQLPTSASGHNTVTLRDSNGVFAGNTFYSESSGLSKYGNVVGIITLTSPETINVSISCTSASADKTITSCRTQAIKLG